MLGILFALCASLIFAFGYVALKKSFATLMPSQAFIIDVFFGIIIWIPFALLSHLSFAHFGLVFFYQIINAILAEAFFFYVLSKGEISITGTILASYPIYTAIFSYFINNEHLSLLAILFVFITVGGTVIVTLPKQFDPSEKQKLYYGLWAVTGALAIGFADTLNKHIITIASLPSTLFALALAQIPIALIYLHIEKQGIGTLKEIIIHIKTYRFAIIGSLCNIVGVLFLFFSILSCICVHCIPNSCVLSRDNDYSCCCILTG